MGVPAFFRWLSTKYPKIVSNVIEEQPVKVGDDEVPIDITTPNPNGEEQDNLYLDMNNIIHPCAHPEDGRPAPANEEQMMMDIFQYIERLVNMVRPRKLLFMAVGMFCAWVARNATPYTMVIVSTILRMIVRIGVYVTFLGLCDYCSRLYTLTFCRWCRP
jgi:XRN 5'-3' exonuclease N-terminus